MRIFDLIALSAQALRANLLRSGLTILGVIIGVTSVIAIVSIIEGMNHKVASLINQMGPATFTVDKYGMITSEEEYLKAIKRKNITIRDFRAIEGDCISCRRVGAQLNDDRTIKYRSEKLRDVPIAGCTPNVIQITDFQIGEGRMYSEFENEHARNMVVIGYTLYERLFEPFNAIGREISIEGHKFTVVGIAKPRGALLGQDLDMFALIPLNTLRKHFDANRSLTLIIQAPSVEVIDETMDEVRMILRNRRHVAYKDEDDFSMVTSEGMMDFYNQITKAVRVTAIAIPAIALVVAGIVVMNIMMVSVTERTREIGIRKSLGARRKFILLQFILEALLMSCAGGIVGIALGLLLARTLANAGDLPFVISPIAVGGGVAISTGIGVIFGLYPALKGSKLDPVDAMRYEN